jgi:hypothetical protein
MINTADITIGNQRLVTDTKKLTVSDVDSLVSVFRILCGPLEGKYKYEFQSTLEGITDLGNERKKAAKLAGTLARIEDEDFGIDQLRTVLFSSDEEQRRIFALFAFSLLYPIPAELTSLAAFERYMFSYNRRVSSSHHIETIA